MPAMILPFCLRITVPLSPSTKKTLRPVSYPHLILLNYAGTKRDDIKQAISALYYSIKNLTEIYGNFILNLGVSLEKETVSLLSQALKEAIVAEWGRLIFFSDRVLELSLIHIFYYNPPYTDGGIEKASANLIAFDKTDILNPGESQVLTISFAAEDMASYDYKDAKGYVLEAGDYHISINRDSHNVLAERTYTCLLYTSTAGVSS